MSTDGFRGEIVFEEDFTAVTLAADKPEWAVDTDPAVQVVATGIGGVMRITCDAGQSNIGGIGFGNLQWSAHDNYLELTARVKMSALGTAAERVFIGFTDVQEDTLTEMPFTGATTVTTPVADPDDAIGFFWEGDMTGDLWLPSSQNSDALVVHGSANMTREQKLDATITAAQYHTLQFRLGDAATVATFSVDGKEVLRYDVAGAAAIADVPLIPIMVATEGTGAFNVDLDWIQVKMGRDN